MGPFRSSTSSSDAPRGYLDARGFASACALAAAVFVAAEAAARLLCAGVGDAWGWWDREAAAQHARYEAMVAAGRPPRILFAGDSTCARDLDPEAFDRARGGRGASYNLGAPANFPLAFEASFTRRVLEAPGPKPEFLVLCFSPTAFQDSPTVRRFEASILRSPVMRRQRGEWVLADLLALARLRPAKPEVLRRLSGRAPETPASAATGFQPLPAAKGPVAPPRCSGRIAPDPARLAVLDRCLGAARARGLRAAVVVPPLHPFFSMAWGSPAPYVEAVRSACAAHGARLLDCSDGAPWAARMADLYHLDGAGARAFSEALGRRFREEFGE